MSRLPPPPPGTVICYSYLWAHEHRAGLEEGRKHRPAAVVLAWQTEDGATKVAVLPVTHSPPADPETALEVPADVKAQLRLDADRSWIVLDELNVFLWPGPDIRPVPGSSPPQWSYGRLPRGLFETLRQRLKALREARRTKTVPRTD
ncbi:MAG: hypothetical protein LDL26_12465 [Caenispirillum bisanense]|nr:hypothetical protein [Caenispirillum bisanense]MCA1974908.1 hypothetical protein [Caenispirillum sp.]